MNPALRVLKNSTALSLSVLLERGVAFLLPWYVARVQGKELWGYYSTALTFLTIAATFTYLGLDQLLPREIARNRSRVGAYLANATVIGGLVSLLAMVVMLIVVCLLDYPLVVRDLIFLGILVTLLPLTESKLCEAAINGLERMEWIVAVRFPMTVLRIAASVFLLSRGFDIGVLFVVLAIYYLLTWGAYLLMFARFVPAFHWQFDKSLITSLTFKVIPFVSIVFVGETFKQIDRVFLSKLWDTDKVGVYSTGAMLIMIMYMIAPAIMTALFPGLSRVYLASRQRFSELISGLFKLLLIGIFPVALAIIALADPIITLVFGQEYGESVIVLQILALGIVPSFVARLLYRAILASDNERLAVRVSLVNSVANVALNILLIPRYGVVGASVAAASTELTGFAQNLFYVSRRVVRLDLFHSLLKPGLCVLSSLLVYGGIAHWNAIVAWALSTTVFVGALVLSRTVTWNELKVLSADRSPV